jgi:hypothetical protein
MSGRNATEIQRPMVMSNDRIISYNHNRSLPRTSMCDLLDQSSRMVQSAYFLISTFVLDSYL